MRPLAVASAAVAVSCLSSLGNAAIVDAGTLTSVTVDSPLYDTNLKAANGCDPLGCVGDLTRDGDFISLESRWSCKPGLGPAGSTCSISFSLGDPLSFEGLNIALFKGDTRTRTIDIYVDDVLSKTWTSSGATSGFETVGLDATGQTIELRGVLSDSEWLSIFEVEILVDDGDDSVVVEASTLGTVTATAAVYDLRDFSSGGCDPSGCTASLTRDGDLTEASRWSCAPKLGGACTISYDLGAVRDLSELRLAMYKGAERVRTIEVYVDGSFITTWTSSGTTDGFEAIDMFGIAGETVELTGVLTSNEWLSIIETEVMVLSGGDTPTSTPSGELTAVGLLPLARGDGSYLDLFYAKDGDFSTSWTCTGDPKDSDSLSYDCDISFRLFSYRHIKQIKIALSDGAEHELGMKISQTSSGDLFEEFVTSSGTTNGFETYDYDYFTDSISISGVFTTNGESISISEVEFIEEVHPGEVSVSLLRTPFGSRGTLADESANGALEWTSDSDDALDLELEFFFDSYATMKSIEMEFPVGDTYQFDLEFYDTYRGDPAVAVTGLESSDIAGWQSFDLDGVLDSDQYLTKIKLTMKGTGSGAPGFRLLDARFIGTPIDNPTDSFNVGSTFIEDWDRDTPWGEGFRYPDFVAEHTGDQKSIMAAICGVKKASFDGLDCVGEDSTATGMVDLPMGEWLVDGNIIMKSGVYLRGRWTEDDNPGRTELFLEEGAAGNTVIDAIVVMDGISDARISDLWIEGLYDPDTSNASPAVEGLGSTCISIVGSQNITCEATDIRFCDGDAIVVRDSNNVNIDAEDFDDEHPNWPIASNRGTGLVVDASDSVWVRRHWMYDNGVAGIHISGSNNFTFEGTTGEDYLEGQGKVGSLDGQQPIEVIIESSSLVTFQDLSVKSANEPVMTISSGSSAVLFTNIGLGDVPSGTCVIQTGDPTAVTAEDDELILVGTCFVRV